MKNEKTDKHYIDFEPENERKRYFVTIQDEYGREKKMEVNAEIFDVFNEERKNDEARKTEVRRHYDDRGLEEYIFSKEVIRRLSRTPEEIYLGKERIKETLNQCTPTQRRRFCLNKIHGYTLAEIARIDGCSIKAVSKSVCAVEKNFRQRVQKRWSK